MAGMSSVVLCAGAVSFTVKPDAMPLRKPEVHAAALSVSRY